MITQEITPIGQFILDNANGEMGTDGMYYHYTDVCALLRKYLDDNDPWIKYDFKTSRPKQYGKYLVARKDGKVHKETWNGSGWAYNEKVIEYFMPVPKAPNQK